MEDFKTIIYSMHPLERKVLINFNEDIKLIEKESKLSIAEIKTGLLLLEAKKILIIEEKEFKLISLDKFGEKFLIKGLPEINLLNEIKSSSKKMSELKLEAEEISAAIGILKREKLLNIKKEEEMIFEAIGDFNNYLKKNKTNPLKEFEIPIEKDKLNDKQKQIIESFKMRTAFLKEELIKQSNLKISEFGKEILNELKTNYKNLELIENLDADMLKKSSWKGKEFRYYDINVDTPIYEMGRRHPMMESNNILRDIFIEMGFKEMEGPLIESAFWNMDVMWIPQDHPARDEQDTFYLSGNAILPKDYIEEVKNIHENGIKRSHTEIGDFTNEIASKRLLRTHSTATSFRILAELGKKQNLGENTNGKYFYVANVFRNEAIDATHLAEFFQAEGFIIADDLSLADLMGFVKDYYAKLGIHKIRFKPTFNPYTEPSMEAHYFDEKMNKWYALINSGIFRPETLKALGLENKRIIAWGMGATRVAALLSKQSSLRNLTGFTCDYDWLKTREFIKRNI